MTSASDKYDSYKQVLDALASALPEGARFALIWVDDVSQDEEEVMLNTVTNTNRKMLSAMCLTVGNEQPSSTTPLLHGTS